MGIRSIVKTFIPKGLFKVIEPYGHLGEAVLFNMVNGFPARGMKVIGVTGTNGKTTTCFLIHKMLFSAGYKVGLMTTVAYGVGDNIKPQTQHMTTVSAPALTRRLKMFKAQKVDWLVLETTSQALAQNRVWGVPFDIAVLTNVTHEHLDWHGSFERYRDAKRLLFKRVKKSGFGIVNADDPSATAFVSDVKNALTYGVKRGDIRAQKIKMTPSGSSFTAIFQGRALERLPARVTSDESLVSSNKQQVSGDYTELHLTTHLPGSFNVYNSLAAAAVGQVIGLSKEQIEQGIAALKSVEGRMNKINEGQKFDVIIDYAHTPDAFEKLFKDLKPVVKGRILAMFGSAGRRDEAKRPLLGEIAGKFCAEVVLTEEDDRDVNGMQILEEIAAGAEKVGKKRGKDLFLVHDREEAIKFILSRGEPGDTVLLLGKGHEKTILRNHGEDPWDEVAVVRQNLKQK